MAERKTGTCDGCGRDGCSITADGVIRHHQGPSPDFYASPDSKRCRGAGLPPRGAQELPETGTGYVCRVAPGPDGCGRPVQLTSNGRARSHLDNAGNPCGGGSDWPIAVDAQGVRTDTRPAEGGTPVAHTVPDGTGGHETHDGGRSDCTDDLCIQARCKHPKGFTWGDDGNGHEGEVCMACGMDPEAACTCPDPEHNGSADCPAHGTGRGLVPNLGDFEPEPVRQLRLAGALDTVELPGGAFVAELKTAVGDPGTVARQLEAYERATDRPESPGGHLYTDSTGVEWMHPGSRTDCQTEECRAPDPHAREADIAIAEADRIQREQDAAYEQALRDGMAESKAKAGCTHPDGYSAWDTWDEQNGTETTVQACVHCGEIDPGWRTPDELIAKMPEPVRKLTTTEVRCKVCWHQVTPLADRFAPDGTVAKVVWTCKDSVNGDACHDDYCTPQPPLVLTGDLRRGDEFQHRGAWMRCDANVLDHIVQATVLEGPYAGRSGEITYAPDDTVPVRARGPEEEPSPDASDRPPAPRNSRRQPGTSKTPGSPGPQPTPSRPQAPSRTATATGPSSTPGSKATAKRTPASAAGSSTKATASGVSAAASTRTPTASRTAVPDAFATPKQAASDSDKHDSYGRYKMLHPVTGKKVNWTRATTFAKSIQDTYALSMWSQRMVLKGAALRSDLTAAASTLEVKADKDRMNTLVEDAKKAAGDKVAANKGTAVHAFTEDRDRALVGMEVKARAIPEEFAPTVDAYEAVLKEFGLEPVPGLIEFATGVVQYDVGGTADRVYRVTRDITLKLNGRPVTLYAGEYVIGDVKTGADLSYGWQEICIQLALYAQGLNVSGVWDWNSRTWSYPSFLDKHGQEVRIQVRTDVGIIPHLPVDRETTGAPLATLYAVDLTAGWAAAVLCGQVRGWRKERKLATPLEIADVAKETAADIVRRAPMTGDHDGEEAAQPPVSRSVPASRPVTLEDRAKAVTSRAEASAVFQEAKGTRGMTRARLEALTAAMQEKLKSFVEQGG